jgi:YfiH family protein
MFMTEPQPNDGFEWAQAPWGLVLECRPLLAVARHFFTAASLRLREDRTEWEKVAEFAGVPHERVRLLRQVHGNTVAVSRVEHAGVWEKPEADAVISDDFSAALAVRVADCAPILIADRQRGAAAAVHAGWRSTRQRIVVEAVSALRREFDTNPADLVVAIGPCLGPCCGEMGEEVIDSFREAGHADDRIDRWFSRWPGGRPHFDLWQANTDQLEDAGVPVESIHVAGLCTRTHDAIFHSYRARGTDAGRMVGVIRAAG